MNPSGASSPTVNLLSPPAERSNTSCTLECRRETCHCRIDNVAGMSMCLSACPFYSDMAISRWHGHFTATWALYHDMAILITPVHLCQGTIRQSISSWPTNTNTNTPTPKHNCLLRTWCSGILTLPQRSPALLSSRIVVLSSSSRVLLRYRPLTAWLSCWK